MKMRKIMKALVLMSAIYQLQAKSYTVRTTDDSGKGSLRRALEKANKRESSVKIVFDIPHSDKGYDSQTKLWTIKPLSPLPAITQSVEIYGFGYDAVENEKENRKRIRIVLSGQCCDSLQVNGAAVECNGLVFGEGAHDCVLEGLAIINFAHHGIVLGQSCYSKPANRIIIKNILCGINPCGEAAGNGCNGIDVLNCLDALIEESSISYNKGIGIHQIKSFGTIINNCNVGKNDLGGVKVIPDCAPAAALTSDYEVRFINGCSSLTNKGKAISARGGTLERLHK